MGIHAGGPVEVAAAARRREVAGYVADMAKDLAGLATGVQLGFLAYLLTIAAEEAAGHARARPEDG